MTGITNKHRITLESILDLQAYNRAHGSAIGDHAEASRAYTYVLGMLDALQCAGKKAARDEAWRYFSARSDHYRDDFARNPVQKGGAS